MLSRILATNSFTKPRPDKARLLAYDLIRQVNREGAYANLRLPELLKESNLEQRDRALATELSYGTLRLQGRYDYFISKVIDRPISELDEKIHDLLRMGVHQLEYMRIPDHAALDSTVELARYVAGESKGSYVNAILRTISRDTSIFASIQSDPVLSDISKLSIAHSHPEWIVKAFYDLLKNWTLVEEALAIDNVPASPHIVAWPGKSTVEEILQTGGEPLLLTPYAVLSDHLPTEYPAIVERRAGVQDVGSQLIANLFYRTHSLDSTRKNWLDLCAGPGGKAALLYNLIETSLPEDSFLANEPLAHRAELIARVVPSTKVLQLDGREPESFPHTFHRILVDAPCTGLGALRRRPEARWRRTPNDLKNLVQLQRELLDSAYTMLEPGGILAYATCSPHISETTGQVLDHLHRHKDMSILRIEEIAPELAPLAKPDGTLQLWTHRDGSDSMFLALLKKS